MKVFGPPGARISTNSPRTRGVVLAVPVPQTGALNSPVVALSLVMLAAVMPTVLSPAWMQRSRTVVAVVWYGTLNQYFPCCPLLAFRIVIDMVGLCDPTMMMLDRALAEVGSSIWTPLPAGIAIVPAVAEPQMATGNSPLTERSVIFDPVRLPIGS